MLAALTGAVHLLAVLAIIVGFFIILTASAPKVSARDLQAINRIYLLTGAALLIAAVAGCTLWLAGGKPVGFYSNNPVFHAKLGLFALLLAATAYTGFKLQQLQKSQVVGSPASPGKLDDIDDEPSIVISASIRNLQKVCLPMILVIPALAWMMARGIGY